MKTRLCQGFSAAIVTVLFVLTGAFSAFAANVAGSVGSANGSTISGWAIDHDHPDQSVEVILSVKTDGAAKTSELARVKADQNRSDLSKKPEAANHAFSYEADWNSLKGSYFVVEAYAVTENGRELLDGSVTFTKKGADGSVVKASSEEVTGPAGDIAGKASASDKKETYLGKFHTTAYCSCSQCSSGSNVTYSGTVPKANHTISADINLYPLGTKLRVGDTVYTVEDIGSSVAGNRLDIFFETHDQALNYGTKTMDVYRVE